MEIIKLMLDTLLRCSSILPNYMTHLMLEMLQCSDVQTKPRHSGRGFKWSGVADSNGLNGLPAWTLNTFSSSR